jgi:hypothetical protein
MWQGVMPTPLAVFQAYSAASWPPPRSRIDAIVPQITRDAGQYQAAE